MARNLLDALALFLLPFAIYGAVGLLGGRMRGVVASHWTGGRLGLLTLCGLGFVALGLIAFGLLTPRREGAYVPAHVENGLLVPGEIR